MPRQFRATGGARARVLTTRSTRAIARHVSGMVSPTEARRLTYRPVTHSSRGSGLAALGRFERGSPDRTSPNGYPGRIYTAVDPHGRDTPTPSHGLSPGLSRADQSLGTSVGLRCLPSSSAGFTAVLSRRLGLGLGWLHRSARGDRSSGGASSPAGAVLYRDSLTVVAATRAIVHRSASRLAEDLTCGGRVDWRHAASTPDQIHAPRLTTLPAGPHGPLSWRMAAAGL